MIIPIYVCTVSGARLLLSVDLNKNLNASKSSKHPPNLGGKGQNVFCRLVTPVLRRAWTFVIILPIVIKIACDVDAVLENGRNPASKHQI